MRFLFLFGLVFFAGSFIFCIMNFFGEYNGRGFLLSLFGMLNASIAMGVSEILSKLESRNFSKERMDS
ncbi:hypothetical protein [Bacillus sp. SG-1]|uniref:hypothetical protein n=1 Tax=Bacillus sp. SG-1 TaxID=161544 RepID=UPI0001543368|nr:hypothetical protein [Bacillus sp. SG-1]EDL66307.1 hypothetical protein BSG1_03105 [Bacillus sp. SG-1]